MELLQSSKFLDALNSLNTKSDDNATTEDIKTVMRYMYDENNGLESIVDDMFLLGGAMFTTAIQYMVTRNIMSDPQAYAKKLETDDRPTKDFKSQANVKSLKAFLQEQCLMNQEQPSTSLVLLSRERGYSRSWRSERRQQRNKKKSKRKKTKDIAQKLEDEA